MEKDTDGSPRELGHIGLADLILVQEVCPRSESGDKRFMEEGQKVF